MSELTDLVSYISRNIVDSAGAVIVDEREDNDRTIIELRVDKSDMGKIIGKQGRTVRALRTILGVTSMKQKKKAILEVVE